MNRVTSKHLFNYQLNGVLDDDVIQLETRIGNGLTLDAELKGYKVMTDSSRPDVKCDAVAKFMRKMLQYKMLPGEPQLYKDCIEQCTHTELTVQARDGNDYDVPIFIHTPSHLIGRKSNAAVIYAHTGGGVSGNARMVKGMLSQFAMETDVVFFNVDYRVAPETKFPKNTLDFYSAVKYIIEFADLLNVDASRIAIAGNGGGGYIVYSTMVMLAQREESGLIKLAIPMNSQVSDYCFNDPLSMTLEERQSAELVKKIWNCIANDLPSEMDDPLLFPAKASDDILQRMPPTIIWESEFCQFITENTRMARRMRRAGRLLEFRVQPGISHVSIFIPGLRGYDKNVDDLKLAIKEYLL